ncbi:MAG: NAD(P)/FAD-dependent oxidoreductase [Candidatus Binatia bacterium]
MASTEYVIIGAGFAGAATAYHLARRGVADILLLEQEAIPGFHSSGRNAAMIRQCVPDAALLGLTRGGAAFLRQLPNDWPVPVQFKQNGSLLLGSGPGWEKLKRDAEVGRSLGIEAEFWTPEQAKQRVPALKDAEFDGAAWCGTDGILDIHALLSGYLKFAAARGTRIRYGCPVREIRVVDGGSFQIVTDGEAIKTRTVINAGGAWANPIGKMAGAAELPLRPYRRHLFVSPPLTWVDASWPFVWDVTHDIYFRPEGGGLLLCACDQQELPPGDPPVDGSVQELLAEKIQRHIPGLSSVSIQKGWAGLRNIVSDGRFVIGWDPKVKGFFWVAGLGGHGVTTSSAVGSLAADLLVGTERREAPDFSPARFSA